MKLGAVMIVCGLLMSSAKPVVDPPGNPAKEVLRKVSDKLNHLRSIQFKQRFALSYPSEKYTYNDSTSGYIEFSKESTIGLKFRFENGKTLAVFNGSEFFQCIKETKSISIDRARDRQHFGAFTFLNNSMVMLKNVLPVLLSDSNIPMSLADTTIHKVSYFLVEFILRKRILDGMGDFRDITSDILFRYQLVIDMKTFLPVQILKLDPSDNVMRATYSDVVENPKPPADKLWYYSTYLGEYSIKEPDDTKIIEAGKPAPPWKLPVYGTADSVSLQQLHGRIVMLEFWIAHCGPCIESVPTLNDLKKKYEKSGLALWALNIRDSKEVIEAFVNKRRPDYGILCGNDATAKAYGVIGFPSVVLIDKKGQVFYAGNFEKEKIEKLIQDNL